jgi:hypothetical protein
MAGPNAEEGALVEMIRKRVGTHDYRPERQWQEDSALINIAYWSGKQRIFYENRTFQTGFGMTPDEDQGYQINMIESRVANAVARVLGVQAEFRAKPETGEMGDRELAALTDRVFDHIRSVSDWDWTRTMGTLWAAITGTVFYKIEWDPTKGSPERYYSVDGRSSKVIPEALLTPQMKAEKDAKGHFEDFHDGDLSLSVRSPFSIVQDTSARDGGIRDCRWIAESFYSDIDVVAERWDLDPKDLVAEDSGQGLRNYEEAIAFMAAGSGVQPIAAWTQPPDKLGKRCRYIEMWERPSREHKQGRRIVYAGKKILNLDRMGGTKNPYAADRTGWAHLPFVKQDWSPHPGRFWGKSLVESLVSPQFYLNYTRSQLARFLSTFGLPNTYVGESSGLDTDNMQAGGGRIYKVNESSAQKVQYGPVPQMPPDIGRFGDVCLGDLNAAASQSEIEAKSLPGQLRSGAAIRSMNEDRYMPLTIPARCAVRAVKEVGQVALAIGKLNYPKDRLLKYLGEDNDWVVEKFNGANLVTELQIIGEPSVTDTLGSEKAELLDAVQSGAFNPQLDEETRLLILSGLHYKTSDELIKRKLGAKKSQEREIQAMLKDPAKWPQGYPALNWQDHGVHASTCVAFMQTPEFEKLDPFTQGLITQHWQQHQAFVQQAIEAQLKLQAQAAGTPGEKGQASQPAF